MSSITVSAAARSVRSSTGLRVLPWLLAILAMPVLAADWYTSPGGNDGSSCASAGTPCQTIQAAINKAGANDTVHVGQGQYPFVATIQIAGTAKNGLKLIGDNSPFDAPIAPPTAPAPASNASELQAAGTSGHTGMIWVNGAQDVTIENLLLQVRHGRSNEGIVTTGNANGLVLRNNYLIINNNAGGKRNAISLNMTAGGNSDQNSTGVGPYSGIYVTLEGNVVQPSTAASGAVSARAVVGDDFAGVFRNNFLVGQTQDIRLRFLGNTAGGRGFTFEGNWVFGAGAWFLSFNDSTQTVYIRNNHFIAPGAPGYNVSPLTASTLGDPDFSSLKLVGATNPVIVEGNEFLGYARYYRGLWIQNWPGVTVQDNSFTPNPTYNGLSTALLVGNKEVWNGAPAPRQLAVSVLRNSFDAGYANANSRAIVFVDDNDASGTATAGSLLVGDGDTANANSFAAGLKWYIGLDEHTCNYAGGFNPGLNCSNAPPTTSPLGPGIDYRSGSNGNTQGRPFPFDVNAYGNRYAGKLVDEMSNAEYSAISTKIYDDVDNSALGIVHYETGPRITIGTIIFSPTSFTWDGNAHTISASLQEDNTAICVVTPASLTEPGSHPVSATCTSSTYNVTDAGTVTVAKAAGTVVWGTLGFDYDGSVQTVTATMNPGAVACTVTGTVGPDAGSYAVHADCADAHYAASDDATAVINRIAGTLAWGNLNHVYDGNSVTPTASINEEAGASCVFTPASVGPNVGDYPVSASCTSTNYSASGSETVHITRAPGTLVWGNLNHVYDGNAVTPTASISEEAGASCVFTPANVGPNVGDYPVSASCTSANYSASGSETVHITRAPGTLAWGNLNHVYDGNAVTPTASINEEAGASCVFTPANVGPNVGDYPVSASCTSTNYSASGSEAVHITRAPGTLAWGNLNHVYDGNAVTPTASINEEAGASCVFTPANVGPNAGDYPVSASCTSTNYSASGSETVHITRAPGTVAFGATNFDFDGSAHGTTAVITQEPGNSSACTLTPTGDYPRTHAGSTTLAASCTGTNYTASGSTTLTVAPKTVTLVLSGLGPIPYDGQPHAVSVTVSGEVAGFPAAVDVSYDGNAAAPIEVGSYAVIAALAASASDYAAAPVAGTLEITVGAAANIAIEGGASFTGIAGQTLSGALPSVKVTDIGAHPVAGVTVTFAAAPGNGSLGGAVQTTDANGIATLGGWTLSPTPGSNTATASAAGVSGTVSFLATGTADASALVVTIDDGRSATQVGRSLTWTIVVGNPRTSDTSVDVLDTLPPELDVGSAQWQCTPGNGASCSASGSGDLDDSINLPVGSSVTYLLTATVVDDIDGMITNTVSVSEGANTITRSDDTEIVIFRDGFEAGGDGAESVPESTQAKLVPLADLADGAALQLTLDADRLDPLRPVIVAQARDRAFAVEAMRIGELVQLRLARVGVRGESPGAWSRLDGNRFALLREGGRIALVGTREALTIALGRDGVVAVDGLVVP